MTAEQLPSDRPVRCVADDALERGEFAHTIVETIVKAPADGYTIAVTAPWGEGKTSVLHFVIEEIRDRDDLDVVQFHPWWFSGGGELLWRFFGEMASQLRTRGQKAERVAEILLGFAWTLETAADFGIPAGGLGGKVARRTAEAVRRGELSALDRKAQLEKALGKLKRPILVVIDDIDRLARDEIVEVLRLIRAVGDLPNVTYLLAFDPEPVCDALAESRDSGERALEKIVQSRFHLPAPRRRLIERELGRALDAAVGAVDGVRFSADAWSLLVHDQVLTLIENARDIARLAGALVTTLQRVGAEVEAADVIALEILRLKEPKAYERLVDAAVPLTGGTVGPWNPLSSKENTRDGELVRAVVTASTADAQRVVQSVLLQLFPAAGKHFEGAFSSGSASGARRLGRVAHLDHLDTYLHRGLAGTTPGRAYLAEAAVALNAPTALDELMNESRDWLAEVLSRLQDAVDGLELDNPLATIQALMGRAWQERASGGTRFERGLDTTIESFVGEIVRNLPVANRAAIVDELEYPDLSARAAMIRLMSPDPRLGLRVLAPADHDRLENDLVETVLGSEPGVLCRERDFSHLLWRARDRDPGRIRARLRQWLTTDDFFLCWLAAQVRTIIGSEVRHELDLDSALEQVDADFLRERLATSLEPDTDRQRTALEQTRAAIAERDQRQ